MPHSIAFVRTLALCAVACLLPATAEAQETAASQPKSCVSEGFFAPPPTYKSVEVLPDDKVTFRICAPEAREVILISADVDGVIPGAAFPPNPKAGLVMTMDASGLWSVTTPKPVPADNYRFAFRVDGVKVPDPRGTTYSEERNGTNSTFEVPGEAGAFQAYDPAVPHGAVSEIEYWSSSLGIRRRAHVYTPPGYMKDGKDYPVLYLVHGAGDSDDSWTSVGHANYILDNLIAAGKAVPMIVIMPNSHTPNRPGVDVLNNPDFGNDLIKDLIPYVESHFRTIDSADSRAMAGLSMGGVHTIRFGLTHPELFHSIGIFSSGLGLGPDAAGQIAAFEAANDVALKRDAQDLKLTYYAIGSEDPFGGSVASTRGIFDKYGISLVFNQSTGGHTWINWRRYLEDFAPRLFK